jgi:hypothetical protein
MEKAGVLWQETRERKALAQPNDGVIEVTATSGGTPV